MAWPDDRRFIIVVARRLGAWSRRRYALAAAVLISAAVLPSQPSGAGEGGVSLWIPGFFGSLAATPLQPGFSFAALYYHTSVEAGADVSFAR